MSEAKKVWGFDSFGSWSDYLRNRDGYAIEAKKIQDRLKRKKKERLKQERKSLKLQEAQNG